MKKMVRVLEKVQVSCFAWNTTAIDAFARYYALLNQAKQLLEKSQKIRLLTFDIPALKSAEDRFRRQFEETAATWQRCCLELMGIFCGIDVSADDFTELWVKKPFVLRLVWNAEKNMFDVPSEVTLSPELQRIVANASTQFMGVPSGTVWILQGTPDPRGGVRFTSRVENFSEGIKIT